MAIGLGDLHKKKKGHEEALHSIKKKNLLPWQSFTQDNSNTSTHLRAYEALNKARERVKEDVYKDSFKGDYQDNRRDVETATEDSASKNFTPFPESNPLPSHLHHFNRPKSTLWSFIREVLL